MNPCETEGTIVGTIGTDQGQPGTATQVTGNPAATLAKPPEATKSPSGPPKQSKGSQTADPELNRLAALWSNLPQVARKAILDLAVSMVPESPAGAED